MTRTMWVAIYAASIPLQIAWLWIRTTNPNLKDDPT